MTEEHVNAITEEFLRNHPLINAALERYYIQQAIEAAKKAFVATCAYRLANSQ